MSEAILWKRLDVPGYDFCRLLHPGEGWSLLGQAAFDFGGQAATVSYEVECGHDWLTRTVGVQGRIGSEEINLHIIRGSDGRWLIDQRPADQVEGLFDLDLGFTPATNTIAIRRLGLRRGEDAEAPAAWLDLAEGSLSTLAQSYRRVDEESYAYEAPRFGYAEHLSVLPSGLVTSYPGLWQAVAHWPSDQRLL